MRAGPAPGLPILSGPIAGGRAERQDACDAPVQPRQQGLVALSNEIA